MGCTNCSTGSSSGSVSGGCKSSGSCSTSGCDKLNVYSWLTGMEPARYSDFNIVEIKFKNTRKEFLKNHKNLDIHPGEPVVVETQGGYDIGVVSMLGELVNRRMRIKKQDPNAKEIQNILRKPNQAEMEKWQESLKQEKPTMLKARHIATELKLQMKISDVEYQADGNKATFYYTADTRVDFRELIRHLADQFKVRIEMRQIGSRQEAGRLGGIGSCGRELCCSTWLTDFRSVSTNAARYQQIAINPQKLAGQCGKLKCCLNYELDSYMDALKDFPNSDVKLHTEKGKAFTFKSDIFKGLMWFSYVGETSKVVVLSIKRVNEIVALNKNGEFPMDLEEYAEIAEIEESEPEFGNVVGQDSLTRFDTKSKSKKNRNKRRKKPSNSKPGGQNQSGNTNANKNQGPPKNKQGGNRNRKKPGNKPGNKPANKGPQNQNPNNPQEGKGQGGAKKPNRNKRKPNSGNKPKE